MEIIVCGRLFINLIHSHTNLRESGLNQLWFYKSSWVFVLSFLYVCTHTHLFTVYKLLIIFITKYRAITKFLSPKDLHFLYKAFLLYIEITEFENWFSHMGLLACRLANVQVNIESCMILPSCSRFEMSHVIDTGGKWHHTLLYTKRGFIRCVHGAHPHTCTQSYVHKGPRIQYQQQGYIHVYSGLCFLGLAMF